MWRFIGSVKIGTLQKKPGNGIPQTPLEFGIGIPEKMTGPADHKKPVRTT
jgi:hypothetical protein